MGSFIMHVCVSEIVKRKKNLSNRFIYGSILPDILKIKNGDRNKAHYLVRKSINGNIVDVPDIDLAVKKLAYEDNEISLGYIAHLVEDYVWFSEYITSYAKVLDDKRVMSIKDRIIYTKEEFSKLIYEDYYNISGYIINKYNINIEEIKDYLKGNIDKSEYEIAINNLNYKKESFKNSFITKESLERYISRAEEEVERIINNL